MSLPHDKAPVADAIGAFSFALGLCGGAGIEPLAAAGWALSGRDPLQRFLDAKRHRCTDNLAQLCRFDHLGAALDQHLAEFGRCLFSKTSFLAFELRTLFTKLLQRIPRSGFGPGHSAPFLLAVGPLR